MIDNSLLNEIMEILEEMDDEQRATELLREFNNRTKFLGTLIMNRDPGLDHSEWKQECDEAQAKVDDIVKVINSLK